MQSVNQLELEGLDNIIRMTESPYFNKARALPFLKWAGGKRAIVPEIRVHMPNSFNNYYEPFVGGGAVFFAIESIIQGKAFLSDINTELMITYKVVASKVEELIKELEIHQNKHSAEYYKKVRDDSKSTDPVKVAARFIYLNKTCFNGLYRVNSGGKFNVPMGRYANPTICDAENLRKASKVLQGASLDFGNFSNITGVSNKDFIYCDPPYHQTFTDYIAGGFNDDKQKELKKFADICKGRGAYIMLSNSDTPFIRELYKDYYIYEVSAPRSINCKVEGRNNTVELLITSYEVNDGNNNKRHEGK